MSKKKQAFMDSNIMKDALKESFKKLSPRIQYRNPVMFVVYIGSLLTTFIFLAALFKGNESNDRFFTFLITLFLWFTVLFANFAEAIAEGRGKAQAESLRAAKKDVMCRKLKSMADRVGDVVKSSDLVKGDIILVKAGEQIPADGEVVEGIASVDESAITGESAPVIREDGGDRSSVTGGTTVVSDWIIMKVTAGSGESFLDKMISMVEGASRKKTPNEIALQILLVALTIIFLVITSTLYVFGDFAVKLNGVGESISILSLIALLVCLAPTTIGALLSSIGIAGMSRLTSANVLATSGRAIEAAGDVDVLLLDKTGTITLGNRQAAEFIPLENVLVEELAEVAALSSLADKTPEGKSIVELAKNKYSFKEEGNEEGEFVPFTARTKMSGMNYKNRTIRKGSESAIKEYVKNLGGEYPNECNVIVKGISRKGGTPLVVVENERVLGVVYLKDVIKSGVKEKFSDLREMGIKTVMITGDNPLTAAAIAAEAGVDTYLAEATPEAKLNLIVEYQQAGHIVAMTGDGTNDAPALAQADVGLAMNSGTTAAKEAANMIDLDSNPTKIIEVVGIGKQLLMTRGALTTFSIANDIAKYFAIIPAMFTLAIPQMEALNIMKLTSPLSAILSALIFNAVIIPLLIPLAMKGIAYKPMSSNALLSRNLLIYGLGGVIVPFIGIKVIDIIVGLFI